MPLCPYLIHIVSTRSPFTIATLRTHLLYSTPLGSASRPIDKRDGTSHLRNFFLDPYLYPLLSYYPFEPRCDPTRRHAHTPTLDTEHRLIVSTVREHTVYNPLLLSTLDSRHASSSSTSCIISSNQRDTSNYRLRTAPDAAHTFIFSLLGRLSAVELFFGYVSICLPLSSHISLVTTLLPSRRSSSGFTRHLSYRSPSILLL
jgi:hypothetical protein